jgi:hypothetical protein
VYTNCENKPWEEQRMAMVQIAFAFGKEMKIFKNEDLVVTCCDEK